MNTFRPQSLTGLGTDDLAALLDALAAEHASRGCSAIGPRCTGASLCATAREMRSVKEEIARRVGRTPEGRR